jgi:hypothetical protein
MPEKLKKLGEEPTEEHIKPEIPEQKMKRELAKIDPRRRESYEEGLRGMKLEVNAKNVLIMHDINTKADPYGDPYHLFQHVLKLHRLDSTPGEWRIKTSEELEEYGGVLVHLSEECRKRGMAPLHLFQLPLPSALERGLIQTPKDMKEYGEELIEALDACYKAGWDITNLSISLLPRIIEKGSVKSPQDIREYKSELVHIGEVHREAGNLSLAIPNHVTRYLLDNDFIHSPMDLRNYGDAIFQTEKLCYEYDLDLRLLWHPAGGREILTPMIEAGSIKSPADIPLVFVELSKNPRLSEVIPFLTEDEISQLDPHRVLSQLIEFGSNKVSESAGFHIENASQEQKEQLSRMLSGLRFIERDKEVQVLLKHGLGNTFQQYYNSLGENKEALKQMGELGINTNLYVYHEGVEKAVFKKTLTGLERLESGEEHIKDRFYDTIMQLFNNSSGEVFKKPGRIFAELTSLDARNYKTPEERAKAIIEMALSNDEKLKESLSILEKYLKSTGTPGSVLVDSEEVKGRARTVLFHVQEIERMIGMPVKPMKGEKSEITITVKLSDKNPLTALTNGNDSGCCVALDGQNNWTLPLYMEDITIQIAEIFITKGGRENRVGQAWLFAGKIADESVLIIDSINITSYYKNANEVYEASIGFVKDLAEKAGFKHVVMGTNYNDAYPYAEKNFGLMKSSFIASPPLEYKELEKIHTFKEEFYSDALKKGDNALVFVIE